MGTTPPDPSSCPTCSNPWSAALAATSTRRMPLPMAPGDIELGYPAAPSTQPQSSPHWLASWMRRMSTDVEDDTPTEPPVQEAVLGQIEDVPQGYPRYSALLASHRSFLAFRRFLALRARLLLQKQDRLSALEEELATLDRQDATSLSLGSLRCDQGRDRERIMSEIDSALADYDSFLERHQRALEYGSPVSQSVTNLQNWVDNNGCIAREEIAYLEHGSDLLAVVGPDDNAVTWLEALLERAAVALRRGRIGGTMARFWTASPPAGVSRDANVHIFPASTIRRAARAQLVLLVTALLLSPVLICNFVSGLTARLIIVVVATAGFMAVLSTFTRARTLELLVSGATYTTVLVVFVSGTAGPDGAAGT
ncbi:hypothetical protein F5X68DRAFT_205749 [Plectosphaerella plurivora]|uniref:DUF6594 domain-containing protein n=1 Tax=Plectosphaerella plurivora TaxID=936078 RepID=A0A9P8VF87_9PEZI|nr:hypothetical protein F5X68DRAFT_205749 [Plectosphaerella plurivora]